MNQEQYDERLKAYAYEGTRLSCLAQTQPTESNHHLCQWIASAPSAIQIVLKTLLLVLLCLGVYQLAKTIVLGTYFDVLQVFAGVYL